MIQFLFLVVLNLWSKHRLGHCKGVLNGQLLQLTSYNLTNSSRSNDQCKIEDRFRNKVLVPLKS
jgi:hypothetical protein